MLARHKTLLRPHRLEKCTAPAGAALIPHCSFVSGAVAARSLRRRPLRLERLEDRDAPASFQGLGDLPGGDFNSDARGVSADGSVVVGSGWSNSGPEAFRWTAAGGIAGLGDLPVGAATSGADGVSADGSVVVGYFASVAGVVEAFRWTAAGGMAGLGEFPGGNPFSEATDVSADGSVVVGRSDSSTGPEAFRWTAGGGMVSLGDLPGGSSSGYANGVSADGSVVVGLGHSSSGAEAFRWTAAGGMTGLGDLPGGIFSSSADGVSADGSVIVGIGRSAAGWEAFRWTAAGGMVGLGDLPGGMFSSSAHGVSADGLVVVGSGQISSGYEAFRWTAAGGMRSVRDVLVTDYGLGGALAGWTLGEARACSADGSVIVGIGTNPTGQTEAWIARLGGPPQVAGVQVNAGAAQRSRVTTIDVTFSTSVTFATTPAAAFQLRRQIDNALVNLTASVNNTGPGTVVTLTFTGGAVEFGSLADGRYTLTIDAAQVSNANGALDGNGDGTPGGNFTFGDAQGLFRFYGDINGDRHVDIADFGFFSGTFNLSTGQTGFLAAFDFNGDGHIDILDFGQFSLRFFTLLP